MWQARIANCAARLVCRLLLAAKQAFIHEQGRWISTDLAFGDFHLHRAASLQGSEDAKHPMIDAALTVLAVADGDHSAKPRVTFV